MISPAGRLSKTSCANTTGDETRRQRYPPLDQLGVVGDRRTASVISADGTVRWLCLPNFDGMPVFGALLDAARGGSWALGPAKGGAGRQFYCRDSNVLVTL